eukprot:gene18624-24359_t
MSKVEIDNKKKETGSRKTAINKSSKETKVVNTNNKSTSEQVKLPAIQPTRKTIGPPVNNKPPATAEKDKSIKITSPVDKPKVNKSNTIVNIRNKQTKSNDSKVENKDLPKVTGKIDNDKTEITKQDEKFTVDLEKVDQTAVTSSTNSTELTNNIDSNVSLTKDSQPLVDEVISVLPVFVNNNGFVKLIYETYNELFPITDGSTTHANIDEVYALSFVMPNCRIHLSKYDPKQKRQLEIEQKPINEIYIEENPTGVYHGLIADEVYYVFIEQDSIQLELEKEKNLTAVENLKNDANTKKDDGRVIESCSCIYGNPCVDEYGCKDWNNRYAIAKANGWKGF